MPVNRDTVVDWMRRFATEMSEHREELVKLDTAIGDGDHGTNMDRGMKKAVEKLGEDELLAVFAHLVGEALHPIEDVVAVDRHRQTPQRSPGVLTGASQ